MQVLIHWPRGLRNLLCIRLINGLSKKGGESTEKLLAALSMVQALVDNEFDVQMKKVAFDVLFNAIDLRLSSEIRNSNVEEVD